LPVWRDLRLGVDPTTEELEEQQKEKLGPCEQEQIDAKALEGLRAGELDARSAAKVLPAGT